MRTNEEIIKSLENELNYLESEIGRLYGEYAPLQELHDSYVTQAAGLAHQLAYYKKVCNNGS